MTPFKVVYDRFFDLVTDDFYSELSPEAADQDCRSLLMSSLPMFEFPERPFSFITEIVLGEPVEFFEQDLTLEEINILAFGMVQIWAQRQTTSIENTRQKFSGVDFKQSSQASHLQRLLKLLEDAKIEHRRLQMLNSRRRVNESSGKYESNFDMFVRPMNKKAPK
ncbi:MAG: hypothetical protein GX025_10720 [Clostridiales bacterium]|nr:hypothetical protein [Clostridiales bacterium]